MEHVTHLNTDHFNWDQGRWPNFSAAEMACRHCGQTYVWPEFMDRLQQARKTVGRPFQIFSAHRCALHNARVGGAPLSQHLKLAVDIGLYGHNPPLLHRACRDAGFRGFGFYQTFIHVDLGRTRFWYGNIKAKKIWQTY
ncbi:MAG: peptidase M15 [Robiginitomaculum sp.]|nr:MAG: peptidase M15 [Robiginitomaculum sp.]